MALGIQGQSKTYGPFAAAIAFGLIVAMAGTLFAVPLFYSTILDVQARVSARWHRFRKGPGGLEGTPSALAASKLETSSKELS